MPRLVRLLSNEMPHPKHSRLPSRPHAALGALAAAFGSRHPRAAPPATRDAEPGGEFLEIVDTGHGYVVGGQLWPPGYHGFVGSIMIRLRIFWACAVTFAEGRQFFIFSPNENIAL